VTQQRVTVAAFVVATVALVWVAVLSFRSPPPCACPSPSGSVAPSSVMVPTITTAASLRIAALEQRLARLESRGVDGGAAAPSTTTSDPGDDPGVPRFVSLRSPSPSVKVEEQDDGALSARNDDPKLTGKVVMIEARRADGTIERIPITVPAPAK
jgi:hypothetical protein